MKKIAKFISISLSIVMVLAVMCLFVACGDDSDGSDDAQSSTQYTITFVTGDGSAVAPITAKAGEVITPPQDPTLAGYDFIGWFETADGDGSPVTVPTVMPNRNITLYARYRVQGEKTYRVIYEYNLGSVPHSSNIAPSEGASGSTVSVKDGSAFNALGYMFIGWSESRNGLVSLSGTKEDGQYLAGDSLVLGESDVTLYAQWAREYTDARKQSDDKIYIYDNLIGKGLGAAILVRSGKDKKLGFVQDASETESGFTEFTFYFDEADGGDITGRLYGDYTYAYALGEESQYLYYDYVTQSSGAFILAIDEYDYAVLIQLVGSQTVVRASGVYEYNTEYGDYAFAYTDSDGKTGVNYFVLDDTDVAETRFDGYFRFQGMESGSYLWYDNGELLNYRLDLNGYGYAKISSYDSVNDQTEVVSEGVYKGTDAYEDFYGEWTYVPNAGAGGSSFNFVVNELNTGSDYVPVYIKYNADYDKTFKASVGDGELYINGYGVAVYSASGIEYKGNCTVDGSLVTFIPFIENGGDVTVGGVMYFNVDWTALTFKMNADGFVINGDELQSYRGTSQIVVIPEEVKTVGDDAFNYTQTEVSIISVTIPDNITAIGARAFQNNYTLRRAIFLSETPISINWASDSDPFRWPAGGFIIVVPEGRQDAYKAAWGDACPYPIKGSVEVTRLPEFEIENGVLVRYNKPDDSADVYGIKIPDNVTEIADDVFRGSSYINSVDLNNVTKIGAYAFYGCTNLATVEFTNVTEIGELAFAGCIYLSSSGVEGVLELPKIVTISANAFNGCESLRRVKLGASIAEIGEMAFCECQVYEDEDALFIEFMGTSAPIMGERIDIGNIAIRFQIQNIDMAFACFNEPTWNKYVSHLYMQSGAEAGNYMSGADLLELDGRAVLLSSTVMLYTIDGTTITFYERGSSGAAYNTIVGTIKNDVITVTYGGIDYEFRKVTGEVTYTTADGNYTLVCNPLDLLAQNAVDGYANAKFNGVSVRIMISGYNSRTIQNFIDSDGKRYDITISFDKNTLVVTKKAANIVVSNITAPDGSVINLHYFAGSIYVYGEIRINVGTESEPVYITFSDYGTIAQNTSENVYTFTLRGKYRVTAVVSADQTTFTYSYTTA